jgi:hypothetical protein
MAIAIQINNIDGSANGDIFVEGTLVPSGNYATNGDVVDFTGVNSVISLGSAFSGVAKDITSSYLKQLWVGSMGGNLVRQYVPVLSATGALSVKLKISGSATFGTEQSAGAYPGDITSDTIAFQATFKKNA